MALSPPWRVPVSRTSPVTAIPARTRPDQPGAPPGVPALPPGWHAWEGVNGLLYARRPRTSPPLWVRARSMTELRARAERAELVPPWRDGPGVHALARERRVALVGTYIAAKAPREKRIAEASARRMTRGQLAAAILAAREGGAA